MNTGYKMPALWKIWILMGLIFRCMMYAVVLQLQYTLV
jgi:hypothetical protein